MQDPKIRHLGTSHKFVRLYLRNKGMYRQSEKKLLNSNTSSTCPHNMVNFPLAAEIRWRVLGTPSTFQRVSRLDSVTEWHCRSELCGVEQRAPPIFGRAAITLRLCIGPHSNSQGSVATLRPVRSFITNLLLSPTVNFENFEDGYTWGDSDVISLYHIYASCFPDVM